MTQSDRVLQYMQDFGSINAMQAIYDLGNTRLSAAIFKLKRDGVNIKSEWKHGVNRYGEKTRYKDYYIDT